MGAALNAFAFTFEGCVSPSTNWNAGGQFHRELHRPKVGGKVPIEPAFVLLWLDLIGVFVFAVDGGLVARALTRLDIVGVVGLGMVTALGGGVMRDLLLPDLPPAAFRDWRYLLVALVGGLIAFAVSEEVSRRVERPIKLLDAAGLSLFAVTGAAKAFEFGLGPFPAALVGMMAAVGGGTIRDVMVGRVPGILTGGLYAIPALAGATIVVVCRAWGLTSDLVLIVGAATVFTVRTLGLHLDLDLPASFPSRSSDDDE